MDAFKIPHEKIVTDSIVLFSTADWDHPFWTNKQHTASALAQRGFHVLYVESTGLRRPTVGRRDLGRVVRRIRTGFSGLRRVQERIWVYSPLTIPFHRQSTVRTINSLFLYRFVARYCRTLNFQNPIVWTYNPLVIDVAARLQPSLIVYHCVDDLASAPGLPSEEIKDAEARLLPKADLVFTTSRALQGYCREMAGDNVHYFPNVVDFDHFSRARMDGPIPDDLETIPRPRIGFIGAISSYKLDFDLLSELARRRPEWHWVLIGQVGEGQPQTTIEQLRLPNIHLLGPRQYQVLPEYLRGMDALTLPCPLNPYTRAMFPMKFFEYLSTGKPVVATPLPALEEFADVHLVAGTAQTFETAIEAILNCRRPSNGKGILLASQYTWGRRTDKMIALMRKTSTEKARRAEAT